MKTYKFFRQKIRKRHETYRTKTQCGLNSNLKGGGIGCISFKGNISDRIVYLCFVKWNRQNQTFGENIIQLSFPVLEISLQQLKLTRLTKGTKQIGVSNFTSFFSPTPITQTVITVTLVCVCAPRRKFRLKPVGMFNWSELFSICPNWFGTGPNCF